MCKPPPRLADVKHADEYTTEDLNADVDAFRLAFVRYLRAVRCAKSGDHDKGFSKVSERNGKLRDS